MAKSKKKIAYLTGTRADFGLMTPILNAIQQSKFLSLRVFATGMHLMPEFGNTIRDVERCFPDVIKVPAVYSHTKQGVADFTGNFLKLAVKVFKKHKPDLMLVLGDRSEMLCTAVACLYLGIPVGHVHGGDKTTTVDESSRHAITKLSQIHFPATAEAVKRIEKMGEEKWRIHLVGAPALDTILNEKMPTRSELFRKIGLNPKQNFILVTQHSVSEEIDDSGRQMREIMEAVKVFEIPVVVVYPNSDAGSQKIIKVINKQNNNPLFHIFPTLSFKDFLALEKEALVWVGNSSGAIIESASFRTPVVNVGLRQFGRLRAKNVIDVPCRQSDVVAAIKKTMNDKKYLAGLDHLINPWGDGKTGLRVARILEKLVINKKFLHKQIIY